MNTVRVDNRRLAQARQHDTSCHLCAHDCGANRSAGERGPCQAGVEARVFKQRIEFGEEAELIPSHLFYLAGCDLRCAFCIAEAQAFDPRRGRLLTPDFFREAVEAGRARGARTLQWVGGEPTIHLPSVLEAMAACPSLPPVVWKTDAHASPEAMALLDGVVSVYLADFKFGNDDLRCRIAGIDRYLSIVTSNFDCACATGAADRASFAPARSFRLLHPADHRLAANSPAGGAAEYPRRLSAPLAGVGASGTGARRSDATRAGGPANGRSARVWRSSHEARGSRGSRSVG